MKVCFMCYGAFIESVNLRKKLVAFGPLILIAVMCYFSICEKVFAIQINYLGFNIAL